MVSIKVYTTPTCPWCVKTKEFLKSKKIKYQEINVIDELNAQQEMIRKSGQMGVPVLDIEGKIIVGFDPKAIEGALAAASHPVPATTHKETKTVAAKKAVAKSRKRTAARKSAQKKRR